MPVYAYAAHRRQWDKLPERKLPDVSPVFNLEAVPNSNSMKFGSVCCAV